MIRTYITGRESSNSYPSRGRGCAGYHHGEILQGLCWSNDARGTDPTPCLVTLPVSDIGSRAYFTARGDQEIVVHPPAKRKAARAARMTLDALGFGHLGGRLRVDCMLPTGLGLGSSTSDVLATMRAVCGALGCSLDAAEIAQLAVAAETASDPLMFDGIVLFAQRKGQVLEEWGQWTPEYLLLSVNTQPHCSGVDTVGLPLPRSASARSEYSALLARARAGFLGRNAVEVAAVATRSAELNQNHLPLPNFRALCSLAERNGCLGIQIAHSGTIAGLLFEPATQMESLTSLNGQLRALRMEPRGFFRTGATYSVQKASDVHNTSPK